VRETCYHQRHHYTPPLAGSRDLHAISAEGVTDLWRQQKEISMRLRFLCCAALAILAVGGCLAPQPSPIPTGTIQLPTPTSEPTQTAEPTWTPVPPPTATAEPTPTATSTATSTAQPPSPEWIALYAAGPEQAPQLYALAGDGSLRDLELNVYQGAAASGSGRWVASPSSFPTAASAIITDLQGETSYTVAATDGWGIYGMAFDRAKERLAFLELAPAPVQNIPWAVVVIDLVDGSTAHYEGTTQPQADVYPGNPIVWAPSGNELLLSTFLPYSDGLYAGVRALEIQRGTASAPVDTLRQRTLIPGGEYRSVPRLSPDGARLLYLARDLGYMPADYTPALDFAVNQLWTVDLASATPTLLLEVTDGDALGADAAWAPDGERVLFAQGHYADMDWGSLALQVRDGAGAVQELAPLPLAEEGTGVRLAWCRPDTALAVLTAGPDLAQLHAVDVETGDLELLASAEKLFVLGCVQAP
jgi:hypothetical protein